MATTEDSVRRLVALAAADGIAWPEGAGFDGRCDRISGPYAAGTGIIASRMGAIVAEYGVAQARQIYDPPLPEDLLRAVGAYYAANRDLFQAQEWREAFVFGRGKYDDDSLPALQADLHAVLGRLGALDTALTALLDVAERDRAGYPVEAEVWFAARDTARAALAGAAAEEEA